MAFTLAEAYVRIRPDLKHVPGELRRGMGPAGATAGNLTGKSFGSAVTKQAHLGGKSAGHAFRRSTLSIVSGIAGVVGGLFVGKKIIGFFKSIFAEARESQRVTRMTAAVIKSTGGAAHVSAKQVDALSNAISNNVGVDDDMIETAAGMILTFTKIRNEAGKGNQIFDRTTVAVTDMAAKFGQGKVTASGLQAASIQLGKALNDPIKGITALSRVGVTFDAGQKKQIKTMVEHGNILGAQKIILQEVEKEFGGIAKASSDPIQRAKVIWNNWKEDLGKKFLPVLNRIVNVIIGFLPTLSHWLNVVGAGIKVMVAAFRTGKTEDEVATPWERVGFILRQVWNVLFAVANVVITRIIPVLAQQLLPVLRILWTVFKFLWQVLAQQIIPAIASVVQWFQQHRIAVEALAIILGGILLGMKLFTFATWAQSIAMKAARIAMVAWRVAQVAAFAIMHPLIAAQWLLNVALSANPIGIIVIALVVLVGAFILAWRNSQTFRNIVMGAWHGIRAAVGVVWPYLQAVFKAFNWFVGHVVGPVMLWFYRNVIVPVWNGIKLAFLVGWTIVRAILIALNIIVRNVIGPVFLWFYRNVIVPVWNGIKLAFNVAWNGVIRPVFNAIVAIIRNVVAPAMTFLWRSVIVPVWNGIKTVILTTWNFMRDKIFTPLFNMVRHTIPQAFNTAKDFIGKYWNLIKGIVAAPIKFVVNTVYKGGIKALWDKVANVLKLPHLPDFNLPAGFAQGGILPGRDTGRDNQLFMGRSGEGVAVPELVKQIGANRFLEWNRQASSGREVGFAKGGIIPGTGGIVGDLLSKGKSLIRGAKEVFAGVLEQFALPIVNNIIKPLINQMPGGDSYAGKLGKAIPTHIVDAIMAKFREEDTAALAIAGGPDQWRSMWTWVKTRFGYATLNSAFRSGDPGYHGRGMAIDIGTSDVRRGGPKAFAIFNAIKRTFKPTILELIYDFARSKAVWNGRDHFFTGGGAGPGTHNDHIHWANKPTGIIGGRRRTSGSLGSAAVARLAYSTARSMGVGGRILLALMEAGLVESGMRNLNYGDRDSVGFLQQRPSQGWPNPMHIPTATRSFVRAALRLGPWRRSAGSLAQAVQRSAFPSRYDARQADAMHILRNLGWRGSFARGGIIPGLFDKGGMLMPGGMAVNMSSKPEQVSRVDKLDDVIDRLEALTAVTSRLGTDFGREMNGVGAGLVVAGRRR